MNIVSLTINPNARYYSVLITFVASTVDTPYGADYRIDSITIHPQYDNEIQGPHDIAIIKLEVIISFNHAVFPICFPSANEP